MRTFFFFECIGDYDYSGCRPDRICFRTEGDSWPEGRYRHLSPVSAREMQVPPLHVASKVGRARSKGKDAAGVAARSVPWLVGC
jgi:hypothetical protein